MITMTTEGMPELLAWAAARIGIPEFRDDAKAFGVLRYGKLHAVIAYDCFSARDCNMHVASLGGYWLTRQVVCMAFHYPFVQRGKHRVTALVESRNTDARRLDEHLGFKFEGIAREGAPTDDLIIYGMLRRDCRFIAKEHRNG